MGMERERGGCQALPPSLLAREDEGVCIDCVFYISVNRPPKPAALLSPLRAKALCAIFTATIHAIKLKGTTCAQCRQDRVRLDLLLTAAEMRPWDKWIRGEAPSIYCTGPGVAIHNNTSPARHGHSMKDCNPIVKYTTFGFCAVAPFFRPPFLAQSRKTRYNIPCHPHPALGDSLIGRTGDSGSLSWGSNPCPPANRKRPPACRWPLLLRAWRQA